MELQLVLLVICGAGLSSTKGISEEHNSLFKRTPTPPWGYRENYIGNKGPSEWGTLFPQCSAGNEQSPINIEEGSTQEANLPLQEFIALTGPSLHGTLQNYLGHSVKFLVDKTTGTWTAFDGVSHYDLQEFHFHFGCDSNRGSEHQINGVSYSGEVQLAFHNRKYGDILQASGKSDGILILASLLQDDCPKPKKGLKCLMNEIPNILHEGSSTYISFPVLKRDLIPQYFKKDSDYFSYKGSFTTPPCAEKVKWIVLKDPLCLPSGSIDKFRSLLSNHGGTEGKMCDNFRPVQPLNGRIVLAH